MRGWAERSEAQRPVSDNVGLRVAEPNLRLRQRLHGAPSMLLDCTQRLRHTLA